MEQSRSWTPEEDAIIIEYYPTCGMVKTNRIFRELGFRRSDGSIRMRAKKLGVKAERRNSPNQWTNEELDVLKREYPSGGAEKVHEALKAIGSSRSTGAIRTRAATLGIREKRVKAGRTVQINMCMDTVLDKPVLDRLNSVRNRSAYVRELVMRDIAKKVVDS